MSGGNRVDAKYAVVGCRECHQHWIVERLQDQDTAQCPGCGHTHDVSKLKALETADDWEVACEQRSRHLAQKAGELEEFVEKNDEFWKLETRVHDEMAATFQVNDAANMDQLGIVDDEYAELADAYLEEQRVRRKNELKEEAESYLERRFATTDVDVSYSEDRSFDVFDTQAGQLTPTNTTDIQTEIYATANQSPASFWNSIATSNEFQDQLIDAVRTIEAESTEPRLETALYQHGVTAANGAFARILAGLSRPEESEHHQRALKLVASIGRDGATDIGHVPMECLTTGPLAVLDAAEIVPTISVLFEHEFRERRPGQREDTLWMIAALGRVADVRVVMSGLIARWLRAEHRSVIPSSFSDRCAAHGAPNDDLSETIKEARDQIDVGSKELEFLYYLAAEPGETLPFSELVAQSQVSKGRVSQVVGQLESLNLIEKWGTKNNRQIDLRQPGSAFLDAIEEEIGRQAELDALFSDSGHSPNRPCNPAHGNAPGDDQPGQQPPAAGPYRTRFLNRPMHTAAVATGETGQITVCDAGLQDKGDEEDRRTRWVSYDPDNDEAVVAVRAAGALQYIVSTALSLASPRFIDSALPANRLEDIDLSAAEVRYLRCIGGFDAEAEEDGQTLRDNLVEWGERLADMTRDLRHGEYEDRNRFRGEIMRSAHGLAGSIVHLLGAAGVEYHRELRLVPSLDHEKYDAIRKTIIQEAQIQSHYQDHTIYRQLFETRSDKIGQSPVVDVDADDPFGTYIGSLTIRGTSAAYLGRHIEGFVRGSRLSGRESAPEIAVRIPVTTAGREAYAETVSRIGSRKNIRSTRAAVTLISSIASSPHAVAKAINWLGVEDRPRDIRLDEVRVVLSRLDPGKILPEAPPSISEAVSALLRSSQPLTQSELAQEADISTRSLRRHLDAILALDMVREVDGGYRFTLPFNNDEERGDHILPKPVNDDVIATQDLLFDVVQAFVDDATRLGDPDDPLFQVFSGHPVDISALRDALSDVSPWIRVANYLSDSRRSETIKIEIGSRPDRGQVSLQTAVNDLITADD